MDDDKIAAHLLKLHKTLTWRKIAALPEYAGKISFVDLRDYANGRPIVNPHHRALFGLPALRPAPVCPECGVVHVKRCPRKRRSWNETPIREQPVELLRWRLENREAC